MSSLSGRRRDGPSIIATEVAVGPLVMDLWLRAYSKGGPAKQLLHVHRGRLGEAGVRLAASPDVAERLEQCDVGQ